MSLTTADRADAPLGVFDSGLGGLSVVRRLQELLPHERIVYVADQAHVPYGGRELGQVCGFACGISAALLHQGCKAIVMACNISSATALTVVQAEHRDVPVLGVILPGAQAAVSQTRNGRIGVLATEGTVRSHAYTRALQALDPSLQVTEVACPAFVPLVEASVLDEAAATAAARDYMQPLLAAQADVVILGCTHYPFLLPILQAVAPGIPFVDPAERTARELADRLTSASLLAPPSSAPIRHLLTTTGDLPHFKMQACRFLPDAASSAEILPAHWHSERLRLR